MKTRRINDARERLDWIIADLTEYTRDLLALRRKLDAKFGKRQVDSVTIVSEGPRRFRNLAHPCGMAMIGNDLLTLRAMLSDDDGKGTPRAARQGAKVSKVKYSKSAMQRRDGGRPSVLSPDKIVNKKSHAHGVSCRAFGKIIGRA